MYNFCTLNNANLSIVGLKAFNDQGAEAKSKSESKQNNVSGLATLINFAIQKNGAAETMSSWRFIVQHYTHKDGRVNWCSAEIGKNSSGLTDAWGLTMLFKCCINEETKQYNIQSVDSCNFLLPYFCKYCTTVIAAIIT